MEKEKKEKVVEKNREMRRLAAEKARTFIEHATLDFREWFVSRDLNPLLLQMQEYHKLVGEMVLKKWETRVSLEEFNNMKRFEEELRKKISELDTEKIKKMNINVAEIKKKLTQEDLEKIKKLAGKDSKLVFKKIDELS